MNNNNQCRRPSAAVVHLAPTPDICGGTLFTLVDRVAQIMQPEHHQTLVPGGPRGPGEPGGPRGPCGPFGPGGPGGPITTVPGGTGGPFGPGGPGGPITTVPEGTGVGAMEGTGVGATQARRPPALEQSFSQQYSLPPPQVNEAHMFGRLLGHLIRCPWPSFTQVQLKVPSAHIARRLDWSWGVLKLQICWVVEVVFVEVVVMVLVMVFESSWVVEVVVVEVVVVEVVVMVFEISWAVEIVVVEVVVVEVAVMLLFEISWGVEVVIVKVVLHGRGPPLEAQEASQQ